MGRRLGLFAALFALLLVGSGLVALYGLAACAPPPLPGDELWTWRSRLGEILAVVLRMQQPACFTADPGGTAALALSSRALLVVGAGLILALLAEGPGRALRRLWFRMRGGHLILLGDGVQAEAMAPRFGGAAFFAPSPSARLDLGRRRPFADIREFRRDGLETDLRRLGAPRARQLAAVSDNDLSNLQYAETALALGGSSPLLVRLEQPALRTLAAGRLRRQSEAGSRPLAVVSLTQMQTRLATAAAMPGRYTMAGQARVHIAIIGEGEALVATTLDILRQGYGRDARLPLISIVLTGESGLPFDRDTIAEAAELRILSAPLAMPGAFERAIGTLVMDSPPLCAVHCATLPGAAEALALRVEEALTALDQFIPPIVALAARAHPIGRTGMIRPVPAPPLAEAEALSTLLDARARAVHAQFLAAQRIARGAQFGTAPAEVPWESLPEAYRDDNRAVADHMPYKLASVGLVAIETKDEPTAVPLTGAQIETLAIIAHERWWAARAVAGWRYGRERDNVALRHPDMQPYSDLAEPVRQKDRDEVLSLPALAALAGLAIVREHRIALATSLTPTSFARLCDQLRDLPKAVVPVVVIAMGADGVAPCAEDLLDAGVNVELVLGPGGTPAAPSLLGRAWRIHVDASLAPSDAVTSRADHVVTPDGEIRAGS